jgi:hypothetical protein
VSILDRHTEPGFVATRLGRAGIARFLTDRATRGPGDTDETKALALLEHHLYLPQILADAVTSRVDVRELVTFLSAMKPQWTTFVFSFHAEANESLQLGLPAEAVDVAPALDLSTTVLSNEGNQAWAARRFLVVSDEGEIPAGGSRATGNFRDPTQDFEALGVGRGDLLRIRSGPYRGHHRVLHRLGPTLLAIAIPDPVPAPAAGLEYLVLPSAFDLGHDAVHLKREHFVSQGTAYEVPSVLDTKTDAPLGMLSEEDVRGLLLVDPANLGAEVQPILSADVRRGEISVALPPPPGPRPHALCAAALIRRDSTGTVTDAMPLTFAAADPMLF